ncbi:hypothetical protein Syun_027718 [Stephania yunnanensis]|uniref:Uncharacterized protein n=1 Tax=Stephania yunnanensis TaxID=152371 RepID=A0AAP0EL74_9MAGN
MCENLGVFVGTDLEADQWNLKRGETRRCGSLMTWQHMADRDLWLELESADIAYPHWSRLPCVDGLVIRMSTSQRVDWSTQPVFLVPKPGANSPRFADYEGGTPELTNAGHPPWPGLSCPWGNEGSHDTTRFPFSFAWMVGG